MRRPRRWRVAGGLAVGIGAVALATWLALPDDAPAPAPPPSTTNEAGAAVNPAAAAELARLLPVGYPAGACAQRPVPSGGTEIAAASCGPNRDPGGPASATYTLLRDVESLHDGLAKVVSSSDVMVCPGNIQSPGLWQHAADPAVVMGTLFCGVRDGRDVLAWTVSGQRLLAVAVSAGSDDASMADLYAWWSVHS